MLEHPRRLLRLHLCVPSRLLQCLSPNHDVMFLYSAAAQGSYDLVTCLDVMIHYPQVRCLF